MEFADLDVCDENKINVKHDANYHCLGQVHQQHTLSDLMLLSEGLSASGAPVFELGFICTLFIIKCVQKLSIVVHFQFTNEFTIF